MQLIGTFLCLMQWKDSVHNRKLHNRGQEESGGIKRKQFYS